jgi:Ca2+/Na+ antiporter
MTLNIIVVVGFAYGIYKLWIIPERASKTDLIIVIMSVVFALILTITKTSRDKKKRYKK